jgi:hypothetical protein
MDLLFRTKEQKKRNVIAPLVITFNPGNPKFKNWIKIEISVLHEDPKLKKVFSSIDVVTRQTSNIKRRVMRNQYRSGNGAEPDTDQNLPPPGNYRRHDQTRCVCCARMEDGLTKIKISKTGREYVIKRHYTCLDTHVVYLGTCLICQSQYVGQTIKEMGRRHYGHRDE